MNSALESEECDVENECLKTSEINTSVKSYEPVIPNDNDEEVNHKDTIVESKQEINGHCEGIGFDSVEKSEPQKITKSVEELMLLSKGNIIELWFQQEKYIEHLNYIISKSRDDDSKSLQESEERLKLQLLESQKKEQYHIMRLSTKEHELQELGAQVEELKSVNVGSTLKNALLDPAVNLLFEKMKRDGDFAKTKMEEAQNELTAWKFTTDSNTGKQLMARCRLLIKENDDIGKMISSGRLAKLEADLAMQRKDNEELRKSQSEIDEFLQEMDEDTEGMQSTIMLLQGELRLAKEQIAQLTSQLNGTTKTEEDSANEPEVAEEVQEDSVIEDCKVNSPDVPVTRTHSSEDNDSSSVVTRKRTRSSEENDVSVKKQRTLEDVVENGVPKT